MIYLVCLCNYEYEIVEGYFTDETKAFEYCQMRNGDNPYYNINVRGDKVIIQTVLLIVGILMILISFFISYYKSKYEIKKMIVFDEKEADNIMRKNILGIVKWFISGGFFVIIAVILFIIELAIRLVLSIQ